MAAPSRRAFADERLVTTVRDARYVFAGPGSPSYALRKWQGTVVPSLLVEKLLHGGCVVFASAAALTLGVATVPVYEIYKCGEDPHWLEGLDVTSAAGIRAAVIPHYDNNEGGTHDTRFCYLGERRLSIMERDLPDGVFVLGVDEHTACTFDLDAGTASVEGRGVVTVRAAGRSATLAERRNLPHRPDSSRPPRHSPAQARNRKTGEQAADRAPGTESTRRRQVPARRRARRRSSISCASVRPTSPRQSPLETWHSPRASCSSLERDVTEWSTDIPAGDELDRAHASLRSLILELGRLSEAGARDPRRSSGHSSRRSWSSGTRRDGTVASRRPTSCGNASPSPGSKCAILPTAVSGYLRAKAPPERRPAPDNFALRFVASAFGSSPHRPAAEDIALSRRKHGFESRWGCQSFGQLNGTFLALARGC